MMLLDYFGVFSWISGKRDKINKSGNFRGPTRGVGISRSNIGPRQGVACPRHDVAEREAWTSPGNAAA